MKIWLYFISRNLYTNFSSQLPETLNVLPCYTLKPLSIKMLVKGMSRRDLTLTFMIIKLVILMIGAAKSTILHPERRTR